VRDRFHAVLGATPAAGILSALAVGDQRAIAAEEWRLFSRTGVTHLMSISGLHVTLVSGPRGWLLAALWRRVPWLALRLPARKAGAAAAIVGAFGYTLLAGFAVPAQRTCYMVTVVAIALWTGGIASPVRTLALAAAVVLAADPWAPLSPGFWLSFAAVALIFLCRGRLDRPRAPRRAMGTRAVGDHGRARAGGAAPLRPGLDRRPARQRGRDSGGVRVVTPLALSRGGDPARLHPRARRAPRRMAAPVPRASARRCRAPVAAARARALGGRARARRRGLGARAARRARRGCGSRADGAGVPAAAGSALARRSLDHRASTSGRASPSWCAPRRARWSTTPDRRSAPRPTAAGAILVPELRAAGARGIDLMVLTHEDTDHIGGAQSVLESIEVLELASSLPAGACAERARSRRRGAAWPARAGTGTACASLSCTPRPEDPPVRRNNQSCVMRIEAGGRLDAPHRRHRALAERSLFLGRRSRPM
jgi:competence protein ComEC